MNLRDRSAAWQRNGWSGYDPASQPYGAEEVRKKRTLYRQHIGGPLRRATLLLKWLDANPADARSDVMTVAQRHTGTAGWSIPSSYAKDFPKNGSQLERYASRLNSVEINSSFSRSHRRETYEKWRNAVGSDFRFSVKVPKAVTHGAGLADCGGLLERFAGEIAGLGDKLAVVLVQLPPKRAFDEAVVERFFKQARSLVRAEFAIEPRHESWFVQETNDFLSDFRVARVAADPVRHGNGEPGGWDGLVYYRLHGTPRTYYSDYDETALAQINRRLNPRPGIATWCVFDNTAAGAALGNALAVTADAAGNFAEVDGVRRS